MEKGFGTETVQRMINILGTHGNYDKELAQVAECNGDEGQSSAWSRLWNGGFLRSRPRSDQSSKAMSNEYKLVHKDDTTFLTEICAIVTEEPAYRPIVEEILEEAAHSLGVKLKRLEKDLLQLVGKEIVRITREEIDERIKANKRDADRAAGTRLRSLIREALDAEADDPTNR